MPKFCRGGGPGPDRGKMSSTLDQAALPSERMTAYPLSRQEAACHKWAIRMKVQLAKYGVAAVVHTAMHELAELDEKPVFVNTRVRRHGHLHLGRRSGERRNSGQSVLYSSCSYATFGPHAVSMRVRSVG